MTEEAVPVEQHPEVVEAVARAIAVAQQRAMAALEYSSRPYSQRELDTVAARAARAARAAIAAVEATLRPAIEAEVVAWLRREGRIYLNGAVNSGETETLVGSTLTTFADAIERGDHRTTKGQVDA